MAPQSKSNALNLPLDKWMRNDALQHKFTHKFLHLVEQLMVWFEFWLLNALEIFLRAAGFRGSYRQAIFRNRC